MPSPRDQSNPPNRPRRRKEPAPGSWLWIVVLAFFVALILANLPSKEPGTIEYSKFMELAKENYFAKVTLKGDRLTGQFAAEKIEKLPTGDEWDTIKKNMSGNRVATNISKELIESTAKELNKDKVPFALEPEAKSYIEPIIYFLLPTALVIGFIVFFLLPRMRDPMGGGFLGNYIKSPARRYEKAKMRVTFNDVAGMQAAKSELQEIVEFLKGPEKFQRLGAQIPKGVLLVGPPGTGKTLLARAVAGEAGVPFFSISGSEFIQMFVGVGASRVRDMFKTAKDNAPCLLFIDEIDAVGRMRGAGVGGGSDEREQTLNQILNEMDGFTPTESVIVIAATNRPDVLDSALLRPGRFDRHVTIDRPTWQGRMEILKVHTRNKPLADDVNLEDIARKMIGMTGADLRNLANEAAILATRENKQRIDRDDFEKAADRVLMGPKREEILTEESKRQVAYHEAGHTLVGWLQPEIDPPKKVTVVPRGRAGGVTFYGFDEDRMHYGLDYFKAELTMMMGGRAAERLVYGQLFAGAESDLKQATRRARYMVTHWGMSERLGPMSFRVGEEHVFLGKEIQEQRDFSETTMAKIDEEVQKLLREADERALETLKQHRRDLDRLVDALMVKEELHEEEIAAILGKHPKQAPVTGPPPQLPRTAAGSPAIASPNGDTSQ